MSIRSSFPSISPSLSLDFAKSKSLDPRITFTRAQTGNIATYVGADGLIKYAGPDEPRFDHRSTFRTNLIKYSETFTPDWAHQRIILTNNSIVSPDGLTNGSKIQGDGTTGGAMSVYQQYTNVQPSSSWTISVFAKAGDAKWLRIEAYDGINNPGVYFNLETGEIGSSTNATLMHSPTIEPYGDGWWRCSCVRTLSGTANQIRPQFTLAIGDGTISVIDTKYFYLWGAQLEEGDTLTPYIATGPSAVTRTRIESLGLLVEESRTNFALYSEDVSNQDINGTHQLNYSLNTTSAPDGNNTADSILGTGISGRPTIQYRIALPASTQLCMSIFVKPINGFDQVALETASYSNWTDTGYVKFDLSKKEILENTVQGGGIIEYPDGWFRIYMVSTTQSSTSNGGFYVNLMDSDGNWSDHVVPTNQGLYLWGGQIEDGGFPTSYVPTSTTSVTRSEDSGCLIPDTIFPTLYNTSKGTAVWEGFSFAREISPQAGFRISTGANLRGFGIQIDTRESIDTDGASVSFRDVASEFTNFNIIPNDDLFSNYSNIKSSTTWNVNSTAYTSLNGVDKTSTDEGSVANWPSLIGTEDRLDVGRSRGISGSNNPFNGHIKQFKLYTSDVSQNINTQLSQI